MSETQQPEPWLRGTLTDVPSVQRAVLHALELAKENLQQWCGGLTDTKLNARLANLAPVAFHVRHIARSIDRLLTYAEARDLSNEQMAAIKTELEPGVKRDELFAELAAALENAAVRIRAFKSKQLDEARSVGRKQSPTTVGGLLVHLADHTQRRVGQAITTSKVIMAQRS